MVVDEVDQLHEEHSHEEFQEVLHEEELHQESSPSRHLAPQGSGSVRWEVAGGAEEETGVVSGGATCSVLATFFVLNVALQPGRAPCPLHVTVHAKLFPHHSLRATASPMLSGLLGCARSRLPNAILPKSYLRAGRRIRGSHPFSAAGSQVEVSPVTSGSPACSCQVLPS